MLALVKDRRTVIRTMRDPSLSGIATVAYSRIGQQFCGARGKGRSRIRSRDRMDRHSTTPHETRAV